MQLLELVELELLELLLEELLELEFELELELEFEVLDELELLELEEESPPPQPPIPNASIQTATEPQRTKLFELFIAYPLLD